MVHPFRRGFLSSSFFVNVYQVVSHTNSWFRYRIWISCFDKRLVVPTAFYWKYFKLSYIVYSQQSGKKRSGFGDYYLKGISVKYIVTYCLIAKMLSDEVYVSVEIHLHKGKSTQIYLHIFMQLCMKYANINSFFYLTFIYVVICKRKPTLQ